MPLDLRRLIIRHRQVAPMLSALLAGTDARVRILDADGSVILNRDAGSDGAEPGQRVPILAERELLGWVEGGRIANAVAAVLSYASARELDKRSLSQEALERYRELNLIYDLAQSIGAVLEVDAVARVAASEAQRLVADGEAFLLLRDVLGGALVPVPGDATAAFERVPPGAGILSAVERGEAEIVNDVAGDPRATPDERRYPALIVAPLVARSERIGVVGAVSRVPHEFRAGDLKVLGAIAALAGPALEQARCHEAALAAAAR